MYEQLRGNNQGITKIATGGVPMAEDVQEYKVEKQNKSGALVSGGHSMVATNNAVKLALDLADELVIEAALAKRAELAELYKQAELDINPLVLVQLPSDSEKTSTLDKSVREEVEQQLAKHGITYENGKLAVWLSEDKQNLELIEKNNSEAEVLIFKEAVAVGWDCPRAQVLVMLRAIRSLTFEIQTVGRILRMPEAKHYEVVELNKAFVYTNISGININNKPEDLDFFKTHFAHRKDRINDVQLPSVYLHR